MNKQKSLHILATIICLAMIPYLSSCGRQSEQVQASESAEAIAPVAKKDKSKATDGDIQWPSNIEATKAPMDLQQISPRTYFVRGPPGTPTDNDGFMSNAGVVITNQGVVIFDALGTPSLAYKLLSRIQAITDQPIVKVIVSHYHADHIYGLQVFKELGAEIIAPEGARDYLASEAAEGRLKERRESLFPWVNEDTYIVKPDRYISEDTEITVGDVSLSLIVLGSTHSQGDLMMRVEPDNVLYSGDLIFEGRIPFVAGSNPEVWLQRLKELDTTSIKAVIPGHGPASDQPNAALLFTKGYLEHLYNTMGDAVENLTAFDDAYGKVDWTQYEKLPAFQVNRLNAYFVYLRLEEKSMD